MRSRLQTDRLAYEPRRVMDQVDGAVGIRRRTGVKVRADRGLGDGLAASAGEQRRRIRDWERRRIEPSWRRSGRCVLGAHATVSRPSRYLREDFDIPTGILPESP